MNEKEYILGVYKQLRKALFKIEEESNHLVDSRWFCFDSDYNFVDTLTSKDVWPYEIMAVGDAAGQEDELIAKVEMLLPQLKPGYRWESRFDPHFYEYNILSFCYMIKKN